MTVRYYGPSGYRDTLVSDLVVSAPVLQFTHAGGQIGMWNHDSGIISDNDGDVTYTLRFYRISTPTATASPIGSRWPAGGTGSGTSTSPTRTALIPTATA